MNKLKVLHWVSTLGHKTTFLNAHVEERGLQEVPSQTTFVKMEPSISQ